MGYREEERKEGGTSIGRASSFPQDLNIPFYRCSSCTSGPSGRLVPSLAWPAGHFPIARVVSELRKLLHVSNPLLGKQTLCAMACDS